MENFSAFLLVKRGISYSVQNYKKTLIPILLFYLPIMYFTHYLRINLSAINLQFSLSNFMPIISNILLLPFFIFTTFQSFNILINERINENIKLNTSTAIVAYTQFAFISFIFNLLPSLILLISWLQPIGTIVRFIFLIIAIIINFTGYLVTQVAMIQHIAVPAAWKKSHKLMKMKLDTSLLLFTIYGLLTLIVSLPFAYTLLISLHKINSIITSVQNNFHISSN